MSGGGNGKFMRSHQMLRQTARIRTPKAGRRAVKTMLLLASFATVGGYAFADSGQWQSAVSDSWATSARWSGTSFPNAPGDSAAINVSGSPYTVTLNSDITVNSLLLDSPDATLNQVSNTLSLGSGTITINQGTYSFSGGTISNATILTQNVGTFLLPTLGSGTLNGDTLLTDLLISNGYTLTARSDLTVQNHTLSLGAGANGATLNFSGSQGFNGAATIAFNGTADTGMIKSSGLVNFGTFATVQTGLRGGTFGDAGSSFRNFGTISAQTLGRTLTINAGTFTNSGTFEAINGSTLAVNSPNFTNLSAGVLTGGFYHVGASSTMSFASGSVVTNNASVLLEGVGSSFTPINSLTTNNGTFAVGGSRSYSSSSLFTNNGTITALADGSISFLGGGTNSGTIAADPGGTIVFNSTTPFVFKPSSVLQGGGSIIFSGVQQMQGTIIGDINVTLAGGTTTFESTGSSSPNGLFLKGGKNVIAAGGTVTVGVQNVNFQGSNSPAIILNSGATPATLKLNGNLTVSGNTTGIAQIQNGIGGAVPGTVHLGGGVRTFTVSDGASSPDLLINARVISGAIIKSGDGMLALTGTNSYAGGSTLTNGTLQIDNTLALGTGSVVFAGGTLDIRSDAATTNLNNIIGVSAFTTSINLNIDRISPGTPGTFQLGAATLGGNLNVSGAGTLQLNVATLTNHLAVNGDAAVVINAPLAGNFNLTRGDGVSSGTLTLGGSSANTFIGTTTLNSGVLQLNKTSGNAIPRDLAIFGGTARLLASNQIADNGIVTVSNVGSTLELNNTSDIIGQLSTDPNGLVIGSGSISTSSGGTDNKGTITARGGTLRINNNVMQVTGNTLTGGTWAALTNSTLTLGDQPSITENDGTVLLSGPGSNFSNLSLQVNAGTLLLQNGRVYSVTSPLLSSGLIQMDAASSMVLAGAPLELQYGRIVGGTVSATGNGTLVVSQNYTGTLDGVTLATDLSVGSASLNVYNGLALNSKLSLGTGILHARNGYAYVYGDSPTISGAGHEILLNPGQMDLRHNGTLTFGSGLLVHGLGNIYGNSGNNGLLNQGTVQSDVVGQVLYLSSIHQDLINNGTMSAINGARLDLSNANNNTINNGTMIAASASELDVGSNGGSFANNGTISTSSGTLALYGNWHNAGTINATNSAVYFGGSFSQPDLGNFIHGGGSINLVGTINNGLSLTSATGPWHLSGGSISGGSLSLSGTGSLLISNGGLDGVALNSDLSVPNNSSLAISNGISLNANLTLANSNTSISGESPLISGAGHEIKMASAYVNLQHSGTVTFSSGLLVHGSGILGGPNSYINQGTVQADVPSQVLTVSNTVDLINNGTMSAVNSAILEVTGSQNNFVNNGTISGTSGSTLNLGAPNGTLTNNGVISTTGGTLRLLGAWHNSGSINATNSEVDLLGSFVQSDLGTFNHTGGQVNLAGTINNGLSLNSTTGTWTLLGGTISGGSVSFSGAGSLVVNSGALDGVTLNSDLTLSDNAQLNIYNGLALNAKLTVLGSANVLLHGDNPSLTGAGHEIFLNQGNLALPHNGTATFASGLLVHGAGNISGSSGNNGLLNHGTIQSDVIGQTLTVAAFHQDLINNGTMSAINGSRLDLSGGNNNVINNGKMIAANESEVDLGWVGGAFVNNGTIGIGHLGLGYIQGAFTNSGTIDNGGEMVIDYPNAPAPSPLATVRQQLRNGFANGAWNGPGINSSAAAASHKTAIAYLDTAAHPGVNSIFGFQLDATSILLEYTLAGDANIDGRVNSVDFNAIAQNFNTSGHEWLDGDFNYDGIINALDFNAVATNYGGFMLFIPSSPLAANPVGLGSLVPEPAAGIMLIEMACIGLFHRRRKR